MSETGAAGIAAVKQKVAAPVHSDTIVILGVPDLANVGLALGLGLLVGVQRGWAQRAEAPGTRFAGVRTYGLFGLAGGLAGVAAPVAPMLAGVLLAAAAALVVAGYWRTSAQGRAAVSGTAALVALLTLACGFMAGGGNRAAAAAAGGSIVAVLAMRAPLHRLVRSLDEREVMAIGRFALVALVILPLLPNDPMGPLEAWKPRSLWLVVVLVSGLSFAGYLAAKWLGPARGMLATAATGAMVSSTAVTAAMASRQRDGDGDIRMLNGAITLASAVMFVRVMVLAALLAPLALPTLASGAVPGMVVSLVGTALLRRRSSQADAAAPTAPVTLRNPFDLGPALLMMALVMALTLAARWTLVHFGKGELAIVLAITGTVDVDSAIIALGAMPSGALTPRVAGLVLLPPILLNTLFKAGVAGTIGGWRQSAPATATLLASAAAATLPFILG